MSRPVARRRRFTARTLAPYLFIAPNLVIFLLFTIWPAINMVNISLYDSRDGRNFRFVGTSNYSELVSDAEFWQVAGQTVFYVICFVIATTVLATAYAVLLNDAFPGRGFFRAVLFLPSLLSAVVIGLLWRWLLDRTNGLVNIVLGTLGLPEPGWLINGPLAMGVIIAVGLWIHLGFYTLIMLSGLQGIDPTVYEAAHVDGASRWQQFRHLTWPLLRPTTLVVVILGTMSAFQSFDYIYSLTGGGPVGATMLMVQFVYERAFVSPIRYGIAAAGSVVLFICVFAFTMLNFLNARRRGIA
ncbi:ABC transporter permease subunit [Naumannella cuiyingiana]|uniref:ABC-type sugar transport system permease subunit n=1 Tax=Naumannella cuiyingiana TaxID=1347891 RepID=A0A7Z0IMD3_9ACTN|nr:ABC-type sugar transport system permease subunit [Naumannella cuiyingiana]